MQAKRVIYFISTFFNFYFYSMSITSPKNIIDIKFKTPKK